MASAENVDKENAGNPAPRCATGKVGLAGGLTSSLLSVRRDRPAGTPHGLQPSLLTATPHRVVAIEAAAATPSRAPADTNHPQAWGLKIAAERAATAGLAKEEQNVRLMNVYKDATSAVRAERAGAGARLWLEFALLQADSSVDDGRDVFKHMKRHNIGIDDADFYIAWAKLEAAQGNEEKGKEILAKAQERGAEHVDQSAIRAALDELNGALSSNKAAPAPAPAPAAAPSLRNARRELPPVDVSLDDTVPLNDTVNIGRSNRSSRNKAKLGDACDSLADAVVLTATSLHPPPTSTSSNTSTSLATSSSSASAAESSNESSKSEHTISFRSRPGVAKAGVPPAKRGFAPKPLGLGAGPRLGGKFGVTAS